MDPLAAYSPPHAACTCTCPCCGDPTTWVRSVKRKLPEPSSAAGTLHGGSHLSADVSARVEVENEVAALREALSRQQQTIEQLCAELEQEQNAASTAASEAMSMILRLQREKAEAQMESRQFKRFAEERMAHDQDELAALDDLLFKREQAVQSLSLEVKAYRHRLASYGIEDHGDFAFDAPQPDKADTDAEEAPPPLDQSAEFNLPDYEYPPLRCTVRGDYDGDNDDSVDLDKYTPTTLNKIQKLESRIYELETAPESSHVNLMDDKGLNTDFNAEFPDVDDNDNDMDDEDDDVGDDGSARVYTIDTVHTVPTSRVSDEDEDYLDMLPEKWDGDKVVAEGNAGDNGDINKLYKRLQSLEADRESMRQAIISMRTEKAQIVLLKEIAQQLCKEVAPERRIVKKPSLLTTFSVTAVMKWVMSFIFWRKKASRSRYSFGLSKNNAGLLLLLDKSPRVNHWRCLASSLG
ncbi:myosin-binding protein 7 isoform X1 [Iris pallida]|uniref:Myosin-binding protein 7 isoform X1 n=1 Tax=Iris pallida TaxID=29817 RepID=A0AAX6I345_IRIPA|nr:myosin-binding protein 7 isoform X1 [Iris pallida]